MGHENQVRSPRVEWRSVPPSFRAARPLLRLSAALDLETSALHLQAAAAELAEQLVRELVLGGTACGAGGAGVAQHGSHARMFEQAGFRCRSA